MAKYKLEHMVVGQLGTNCYFLRDEATGATAVIDPGGNSNKIIEYIKENNLEISAIINTHGHFDHITANSKVAEFTGVPIIIHNEDEPWLRHNKNGIGDGQKLQFVSDGDVIKIGEIKLNVLHTPGHTPGGISLYLAAGQTGEAGLLFSGDTLFFNSVGRTDLIGGDFDKLMNSICKKLLLLPDETTVFPGHGPSTTIGNEKEHNPYLRS
ncbi:MAG: MBL fold metallo-hydrolase [Clostridia bacterium]|nr:MBL fold metallo-hydrolase [Clostridia bacterium]